MKTLILSVGALAAALTLYAPAPETPKPMVSCYESLADTILAVKKTEHEFVRSVLDYHLHAAKAYVERGEMPRAAAEVALFANEGDNAIGGVRKRLLQGGHHHNAAGEAKGIYEPGFVIVTREAKQKSLAAAAAMRQTSDAGAGARAWDGFVTMAEALIAK